MADGLNVSATWISSARMVAPRSDETGSSKIATAATVRADSLWLQLQQSLLLLSPLLRRLWQPTTLAWPSHSSFVSLNPVVVVIMCEHRGQH